jgi:hypothetical protein
MMQMMRAGPDSFLDGEKIRNKADEEIDKILTEQY